VSESEATPLEPQNVHQPQGATSPELENARQAHEAPQGEEPQERLNQITVAAFFAADHVAEVGGKLYINGGFFNMLRFAAYPTIVQTLGIGASLHIPWHAYQEDHRFVVTLRDEDRRELPLRIEGAFRVGPDIFLRHGDSSVMNIGGNVTKVIFQRPGHYHLALEVNDDELARWDLYAVQLPAGFPSAAGPVLPPA
jgi:hypothetical protein